MVKEVKWKYWVFGKGEGLILGVGGKFFSLSFSPLFYGFGANMGLPSVFGVF
jgi:hypothetical protein